ncbi:hypothetical protein CNMCM7691_005746 [Aspergillus felis]|uniref:Glucose-methanol-choline oxidoreductase C-terminal domain-containing protein n=1 Tax=Aspergillus felis TaxID=1287682 RepID=A0A8H6V3M0_9EURO|nr:hypothetical protein CNMCM7691_005746 [Aspergillus felis]
MDANVTTDVDLVSHLSERGEFDFIVVGSGIGGGILAQQLAAAKKRVLVVEKGGLVFSTHCLNTSRPHWQVGSVNGPSQDNDIVFNTVKSKVQTAAGSDPYVGGPVYCLGGRSTVWGLYAPRVSQQTIDKYFPQRLGRYLRDDENDPQNNNGYKKAFRFMSNSSQEDGFYPSGENPMQDFSRIKQQLEEAIREHDPEATGVELAPIAGEFKSLRRYQFPKGAYSTVDGLLGMAYAKNEFLTILLKVEAISVTKPVDSPTHCLAVRTMSDGRQFSFKANKAIILCAGTIDTARIALRSDIPDAAKRNVGKGLTDHEIWGVRFHRETAKRLPPLKLQSNITLRDRKALLNVVVNADTFFGSESSSTSLHISSQYFDEGGRLASLCARSHDCNTVNVTLEFSADLVNESRVLNTPSSEPVICVQRRSLQDENSERSMQDLATSIRNRILDIQSAPCAPRLLGAGFGVVAHEVGTMRLKGPNTTSDYVVEDTYKVRDCPDLYVCDLSVFPVSPPANPTLTLAAMALQLAEDLVRESTSE